MEKFKRIGHYGKALASGVGAGVLAVVVFAVPSYADAVSSGFTSLGTTLSGYLGDAVTLVLLLVGISIGIRMLIHWGHRAAGA
jgi:hypothetical protein